MKWYRGQRLRRIRRLVIAAALIFCSYGVWALDSLERGYLGDFPALFSMAFARIWHVPSAPYDLYATDTESRGAIPFTVTWPTEPDTSTTVSATSLAELQSAINAGARIIDYSGTSSSSLTMNDDVWIRMADGSSIGAITWPDSTVRTKISAAGTARNPTIGTVSIGSYCTDVQLENITIDGSYVFHYDVRRIAYIGCDIACSANYFAFWEGGGVGTHNTQDVIFANSRITMGASSGASSRWQHIDRLVMVDSLIDVRAPDWFSAIRFEHDTNHVWIRNTFSYGDGGGGWTLDPSVGNPDDPSETIHDVWAYDSGAYSNGLLTIQSTHATVIEDEDRVYNITMDDVLFHSDSYTPGNEISGVQAFWVVGVADYADFVSFPTWSFQ